MSTFREEAYELFGKKISVCCADGELGERLFQELNLYPKAGDMATDLRIEIVPNLSIKVGSQNPATHAENEGAILMKGKQADMALYFEQSGLEKIQFKLNKAPNVFRSAVQRWVNMQFTNRQERIGQILHEMALVASVYFMSDRVPVHSSAVKKGDDIILLGGTGGVGKTSLELEICEHNGGLFLADDITVVSEEGIAFPNLNFPKIYGYNIQGKPGLKARLLTQSGWSNRLHWQLHEQRGLSFVRRRISPQTLYGDYATEGGKITRYLLLSREERNAIKVKELDPKLAAEISVDILRTEFAQLNNHLHWHRLNSIVLERKQLFDPDEIFERWTRQLVLIFSGIRCELVKIPLDMDHEQFKKEMVGLL